MTSCVNNCSNIRLLNNNEISDNKYLVCQKTKLADEFFKKFISDLENNSAGTTMQQTAEGLSGFNFVCTTVEGDHTTHFFLKILKREDESLQEVSGNTIVKNFGLLTPDCCRVSYRVDRKMGEVILKQIHHDKPESGLEGYSINIMDKVEGISFKQFFQTGKYREVMDWSKIQQEMGETAILDLFMGNYDRFFTLAGSHPVGKSNLGNAMLGKLSSHSSSEKLSLILIDNQPYREILKVETDCNKKIEQMMDGKPLASLSPLRRKRIMLLQQESNQSYIPQLIKNANLALKKVLDGSGKEKFILAVKEGVMYGIRDNIDISNQEYDVKGFNRYRECFEKNIAIGVERGISKLKKRSQHLLDTKLGEKLSKGFQLLMEKNKELF